ncbi:unnamed protein product [Brachionus calyciflorus]|uniref:Uncharacterized protein n=1 Tax=Brachionus calyciflorus TaxID=104777 RepID=A0A814DRQ8_9BILA|nr:unnamed protein product [Brachionus calyciflorus]
MLKEVLKYLTDESEQTKIYLDMTFGAGGHTEAILKSNPHSIVYASDRDPRAFKIATQMAEKYQGRLYPMNGKFSDLKKNLESLNVKINSIHGALIDCGVSSIQFDDGGRGFSISKDGPLDMRMSSDNEPNSITASDVVNKLNEEQLGRIIWKYGEEKMYKKIAHGIVYFRSAHGNIQTTKQLADLIATIVSERRTDSLSRPTHVATKTFQALRIFVNNELNELYNGITQIHKYLCPGGRLAVISFHSLEDRIVKSHFNEVNIESEVDEDSSKKSKTTLKFKMNNTKEDLGVYKSMIKKKWEPLNKKIILPSQEEIEINPRARSAKLRVATKI